MWFRKDRAPKEPREKRSEEHTSELQSQSNLVCRLLLEKQIHRGAPHAERRVALAGADGGRPAARAAGRRRARRPPEGLRRAVRPAPRDGPALLLPDAAP